MQRIVSVLSVTALAAAALLIGPAASAAPRDVRGERPVYLALGDSLALGQQSTPLATSFERTVARWRASGFVAQFHDTLRDELDCRPARRHGSGGGHDGCRQLQVVNLARTGVPGVPGSGVTTATLLADGGQLDQAVALIRERNGDASPRNDVRVVSVTVGGNDLFGPAVTACVPLTLDCGRVLQATFGGFTTRYAQILGALRAADPDLVVLTTTYDNPLPSCVIGAAVPEAGALGDLVLEGGGLGLEPSQGFNDIIRAVSAQYGAIPVDTFGLLGPDELVGGQDCLHPDADGHRVIAEAFAAAFRAASGG